MHPPSQETTTEGSQTPRRIQIEFSGEELVGIFFMDINQLTVLRAQRLHHSLINFPFRFYGSEYLHISNSPLTI